MVTHPPQAVTLLVNGLVWSGATGDAELIRRNEAIAIGGGRVLAIGGNRQLRAQFPGGTVVDLGGRAVIPGLIDAHSHAVRGGLTWRRELHWGDLTSRGQAIDSIRAAAAATAPGTWITAIGGWHQSQFGGWLPSQAELDAAAGDHPVYLQSLYEVGIASTRAAEAVGLARHARTLPDQAVALAEDGTPTGVVSGLAAFTLFAVAAGAASRTEQLDGTRSMVRYFASRGITGVCDPGGFGMGPDQYWAIDELARRDQLDARFRLFLSATERGSEAGEVGRWLADARFDGGTGWLATLGIGEVVHFGCHDFEGLDEFEISDESLAELREITVAVARASRPMHLHAVTDASITRILDCWESVDDEVPISDLRFSIAHADRISRRNIRRAAALGVGVIVDARLSFRSAASRSAWGVEAMRSAPPLGDLVGSGIRLGVGSDATRASSDNPWHTLWSLVVGRSVDGGSQRDRAHLLARADALAAHTHQNAWFSFEEADRGRLEPGWRSDLAVLDADYFRVDADAIGGIRSVLTIVGDRVSHSTGDIADAT